MQIESFHIQGFKSLADVKVEGLSDINVFYGLNDVGKSNILQGLALWLDLFFKIQNTSAERQAMYIDEKFGPLPFRLGNNAQLGNKNHLNFQVQMNWEEIDPIWVDIRHWLRGLEQSGQHEFSYPISMISQIQTEIRHQIDRQALTNLVKSQIMFLDDRNELVHNSNFYKLKPPTSLIHIIQANRRFQAEKLGRTNDLGIITDQNLKQALFDAYLSRDLQQKQQLTVIKDVLAEPPFNLGELDIALDPETSQIDIGFIRPHGRIPLENLGTGVQQLLLMLGQIFLNNYDIVAIEEPEMNLSPDYQKHFLTLLRKLMQDPATKLKQLFISSHSPYFEFAENFFDVTMDERGTTQVRKRPLAERKTYFPDFDLPGEDSVARLNSMNQVELYADVIQDLGLTRGDMVFFIKNEDSNRWELYSEHEVEQKWNAALRDEDDLSE